MILRNKPGCIQQQAECEEFYQKRKRNEWVAMSDETWSISTKYKVWVFWNIFGSWFKELNYLKAILRYFVKLKIKWLFDNTKGLFSILLIIVFIFLKCMLGIHVEVTVCKRIWCL